MSVSIPDPQPVSERTPAHDDSRRPGQSPEPTTGNVVQLPLDAAARQRREALRVTHELRRQLALLSRHYAADATRFQQDLAKAQARTREAQRQATVERGRSAHAEATLFEMRGDFAFVRERLARERNRAARLAEVARLPWWAFGRRRWALASIEADDAL